MIKPFSSIQVFDDWNDVQSKSMDLLRFPLAVAIVFCTMLNMFGRREWFFMFLLFFYVMGK